jgi:hypothetical protein
MLTPSSQRIRRPHHQRHRTSIRQAVLPWKKKKARTGRAPGQRDWPLKRPNRACDAIRPILLYDSGMLKSLYPNLATCLTRKSFSLRLPPVKSHRQTDSLLQFYRQFQRPQSVSRQHRNLKTYNNKRHPKFPDCQSRQ